MNTQQPFPESARPQRRAAARRPRAASGLAFGLLLGLGGCVQTDGVVSRPRPRQAEPAEKRAEEIAAFASTLAAQGEKERALAELERAIAINPKFTSAHLSVGDIYQERGDYTRAEQAFSRAATLEPENYDAQYKHGLVLQLLDRAGEAVRAYLRALEIRPDSFDACLNLATAYLQLNEPAEALPYAERSTRLNPRSGPAHVNLGAVYAALGRHEDAVASYLRASEFVELGPQLLLNLADSQAKAGDFAAAGDTLNRLIAREPTAIAYERLGASRFRARAYDEAIAAFRTALEFDPDYYPALNGVGVCLLNQYVWSERTDEAALDEALAVLRRSLQVERRQPRILELVTRYGTAGR